MTMTKTMDGRMIEKLGSGMTESEAMLEVQKEIRVEKKAREESQKKTGDAERNRRILALLEAQEPQVFEKLKKQVTGEMAQGALEKYMERKASRDARKQAKSTAPKPDLDPLEGMSY